MKWTTRILLFQLLATFLIGNIGVNFITHHCSINGSQTSLFIAPEDPCNDHHVEKLSSCCEETEKDKGCCSTETDIIKLSTDFSDIQSTPNIQIIQLLDELINVNFNYPSETISSLGKHPFYVNPPPLYQGRALHLLKSVHII